MNEKEKDFLRSLSEKIVANFDFKKVVDSMVSQNLTWIRYDEKGYDVEYFPDEEELRNCVIELFRMVLDSDGNKHKISSGGFTVEKNLGNSPGRWLKLKYKFKRGNKKEEIIFENKTELTYGDNILNKKSIWIN